MHLFGQGGKLTIIEWDECNMNERPEPASRKAAGNFALWVFAVANPPVSNAPQFPSSNAFAANLESGRSRPRRHADLDATEVAIAWRV
jgi:hypothetical protein